MGLLGSFFAKLLGRGSDGGSGGSGGAAQEPDPLDRLSRIAQRGRDDKATRPIHNAPPPTGLVPPPGTHEMPAPAGEAFDEEEAEDTWPEDEAADPLPEEAAGEEPAIGAEPEPPAPAPPVFPDEPEEEEAEAEALEEQALEEQAGPLEVPFAPIAEPEPGAPEAPMFEEPEPIAEPEAEAPEAPMFEEPEPIDPEAAAFEEPAAQEPELDAPAAGPIEEESAAPEPPLFEEPAEADDIGPGGAAEAADEAPVAFEGPATTGEPDAVEQPEATEETDAPEELDAGEEPDARVAPAAAKEPDAPEELDDRDEPGGAEEAQPGTLDLTAWDALPPAAGPIGELPLDRPPEPDETAGEEPQADLPVKPDAAASFSPAGAPDPLEDPAAPPPDEAPPMAPADPLAEAAPGAAPSSLEEDDLPFALAAKPRRTKGLGLSPMGAGEDEPIEIEAGDRTAILFRQIFPPPHDGRQLSFFGGAPIASPGFEWPRPEGGGAPFTFLMQVDCGALPAPARMGMAGSGILYVFMDLTWGQQENFRIVHEAAEGARAEIAPPDDLPPAFGAEARHIWRWPRGEEALPRLLPKWPFEPVSIDIPAEAWPDLDEGESEETLYLWPGGEAVNERMLAAQGEEVRSDPWTIQDFIAEDGSLIRPFAHFPQDAAAIKIATGLLLKKLERGAISTRAPDYAALTEEDRAALLHRIGTEAQDWYDRAASAAAFEPVPQEDADEFWGWLASFPWLTRFVMGEAMTLSIEASLAASAEAAARVPPEAAEKLRARHALAVTTDEGGLHVNIPDRMLAPPIDVQGNQAERAREKILLLEISSNEGLGHHFGEGVCQFWIDPEDLKAGRFDNVELTADAY